MMRQIIVPPLAGGPRAYRFCGYSISCVHR
jgi:hypothetical protein